MGDRRRHEDDHGDSADERDRARRKDKRDDNRPADASPSRKRSSDALAVPAVHKKASSQLRRSSGGFSDKRNSFSEQVDGSARGFGATGASSGEPTKGASV